MQIPASGEHGRYGRGGAAVSKLLWEPSAERVSAPTSPATCAGSRTSAASTLDGYDALWQWSVDDLEEFWASIWDFFDVRPARRTSACSATARCRAPSGSRARGSTTPSTSSAASDDDAVAIRHASELRDAGRVTWGELRDADRARSPPGCARSASGRGDRVVAYLPNIPEAIAAFLAPRVASARSGRRCSPDFGARSVVDRFAQIEPKVLLAVDGYRYGGKDFDRRDVVAGLRGEMPVARAHGACCRTSAPATLDARATIAGTSSSRRARRRARRSSRCRSTTRSGCSTPPAPPACPSRSSTARAASCSSTSRSCTCTSTRSAGDRVFWFTTTGWMMWNFLVGVLLTTASIVLYDGNPGTPTSACCGTSPRSRASRSSARAPRYIAACMKAGVEPAARAATCRALHAVGSTGSPLSPEGFDWVYDAARRATRGCSRPRGGTDVCTAFVGGVPTLPVYAGELQARSLGRAGRGVGRGRQRR